MLQNKRFHNQLPGLIVTKDGDTIDHIDRYTLDNRRNNLRFVSMRIQIINRNKQKITQVEVLVFTYPKMEIGNIGHQPT